MTGRARFAVGAAALWLAAIPGQTAFALITGGEGNQPIADPGWPKGAAAIVNVAARVAWWEGPPFGGGQWHAECRGDAKALNAVLADFAKLDVKTRRILLHDGVGQSFWLGINRDKPKTVDTTVDWVAMVWQPANWERLRKLPADLNPTDVRDARNGPPAEIDVYAGGHLNWADVIVPRGLEVVDQRLEAHGFTLADGVVLEGNVTGVVTRRPVAARVRLQRIEPQPKGGYLYRVVAETVADVHGHWVMKHTPAGWFRIVIDANGLASRVIGHAQFEAQPGWHFYEGSLAPLGAVAGQVSDDAGQPLAGVEVRLQDLSPQGGGRYESPLELTTKTGADGHFRIDQIPTGRATIWVHKPGYCRPGLGLPVTAPSADVKLAMKKSASLKVTVEILETQRPEQYLVNIEAEGGAAVGKWGGSAAIDGRNQVTFQDVPPGRYVVHGRPNPSQGKDQTDPVTVDLKGGQQAELTLSAK